jgi:energy-coupling factor transport system substrate-specific component
MLSNWKAMSDSKVSVKDVAYLGMSLAILEASKLALDLLPNIEVVTLLFIVYTIFYGRKTILVAIGFTAIECFLKGFNVWSFMYLYIWPLLIIIVYYANRHKVGYGFYCILSGFFGLFFGMFCSIPYLFIGGWSMAITWWIAGIPYDIIHCVSNFVLCLLLFNPLCAIMRKVIS